MIQNLSNSESSRSSSRSQCTTMYVQISSRSVSMSNPLFASLFESDSANKATLEACGVMATEKGHETTLLSQDMSSVVRTDMPDTSGLGMSYSYSQDARTNEPLTNLRPGCRYAPLYRSHWRKFATDWSSASNSEDIGDSCSRLTLRLARSINSGRYFRINCCHFCGFGISQRRLRQTSQRIGWWFKSLTQNGCKLKPEAKSAQEKTLGRQLLRKHNHKIIQLLKNSHCPFSLLFSNSFWVKLT